MSVSSAPQSGFLLGDNSANWDSSASFMPQMLWGLWGFVNAHVIQSDGLRVPPILPRPKQFRPWLSRQHRFTRLEQQMTVAGIFCRVEKLHGLVRFVIRADTFVLPLHAADLP